MPFLRLPKKKSYHSSYSPFWGILELESVSAAALSVSLGFSSRVMSMVMRWPERITVTVVVSPALKRPQNGEYDEWYDFFFGNRKNGN